MIRKIYNEIYDTKPAIFSTSLDIDEAVSVLSRSTKKSVILNMFSDVIIGSISLTSVKLQRHNPWFHNAFSPKFSGTFCKQGDKTILSGNFQLSLAVRVFMTFWFGFIGFWIIGVALFGPFIGISKGETWLVSIGAGLMVAVFGIAFAGLGLVFIQFLKKFSTTDISKISAHIETQFNAKAA